MKKTNFGKVAVLMGGRSAERKISLLSGRSVLAALQSCGVEALAFDTAERELTDLKHEKVSRCFIALHGRGGEDGSVQGALELMGIPYTGSGVLASSLAMDKVMTKRVWAAEALRTPGWREVHSVADTEAAFEALGAPLIVKPVREGSTLGLSKVTRLSDCAEAYQRAARHDARVLCEQFVAGEEVTCAILGTGALARALPVIRIVAPGGNYDYESKYFSNDTQYVVPAGLPGNEEASIQEMVLKAYHALGCRGWARADVMIDARTRTPWLLEINTAPGMTDHSLVPMAARAVGIGFEALCLSILDQATLDGTA